MSRKNHLEDELNRGAAIRTDDATLVLQRRLNSAKSLEDGLNLYFDFYSIKPGKEQDNFLRLYDFLKRNEGRLVAYMRKLDPEYFLDNKMHVYVTRISPDIMRLSAEKGKYVLRLACMYDFAVEATLQAKRFKPVREGKNSVAPSRKYLDLKRYKVKDLGPRDDIVLPSSQFNYSNTPYRSAVGSLHTFFNVNKLLDNIGKRNSTAIIFEYFSPHLFKRIHAEERRLREEHLKSMCREYVAGFFDSRKK